MWGRGYDAIEKERVYMDSELKEHAPLILGVVLAANNSEVKDQIEPGLVQMEAKGLGGLVDAIRRIWSGQRDPMTLCRGLDEEDSMIIQAILQGLADPDSLKPLIEAQTEITTVSYTHLTLPTN